MEFEPIDRAGRDAIIEVGALNDQLDKYTRNSKWFIGCAILFLFVAFVLLQFVAPKYSASASILIKETEEGSSAAGLSTFEGLGLFGDGTNSLENEIQILKSRKLMTNVVNELKLNIRYFEAGFPLDKELFSEIPIGLVFEHDSIDMNGFNTEMRIYIKSEERFDLETYDGTRLTDLAFNEFFVADLGRDDEAKPTSIKFVPGSKIGSDLLGTTQIVKLESVGGLVDRLMRKVTIEPINTNLSKVISISIKNSVPSKGIAIINNLIEQYNADGINDKNLISQNTIDFLDERIELISAELVAIEGTAEQFKSINRMVDAQDNAAYFLESSSLNERELVTANTELQLINYVLEELASRDEFELLPGNIGLSDPGILDQVAEYNSLVLQRDRVLKSSSEINPIIVQIDTQLSSLKYNLVSGLNNLKSSTVIQIEALNNQGSQISSKIASIPKNEREYKDIVRQQETKNALYLFMLQKREESILSNAVNVDKAKVIDTAHANWEPVSPKKGLIYLASVLMGLFVPFVFIYARDLLDTKIHDEKDLSFLGIPYIGEVPQSDNESKLIMNDNDSHTAEAFRYIRTNLGFMFEGGKTGNIIMVTSTQSGEGKSLSAINLAHSFAISGKRTILIDLDLRAPKVPKYLGLETEKGTTNFIMNKHMEIEEIVSKANRIGKLFDVIMSGDIPPNPVELLMNERVDDIFEFARQNYDYVIVDTAPVGMVTDTIQISRYSNLTMYVVKANYLDKRMLYVPKRMYEEKKLVNMCLLLNGSEMSKKKYGYGYGYGKKKKKKGWFGN